MSVIQLVRFHTLPTTDAKAFEAINARLQADIAPTLPGLRRREAACSADGEWLIAVRWADLASAKAPPPPAAAEVSKALMSQVDKATLSVSFYELKSE